jgi:hypothetical protein
LAGSLGACILARVEIRVISQKNPVSDEVSALWAVVWPILVGLLAALKTDVLEQAAGIDQITLEMLAVLYQRGDADCGICFEYALHDAIRRGDARVLDHLDQALWVCDIPGTGLSSILLATERTGSQQLIGTPRETLTPQSQLVHGENGLPIPLTSHLDAISAEFRTISAQPNSPQSISGTWCADLFLGRPETAEWVSASVRTDSPNRLPAAPGLRMEIIPTTPGKPDSLIRDDRRNVVILPLPWDGEFMEVFSRGWTLVQQFIDADANVPTGVGSEWSPRRHVAQELFDRRQFPLIDVIQALHPIAQPHLLLKTEDKQEEITPLNEESALTGAVIAPISRML